MSSIQGRIQNPVLKYAEGKSVGKIGWLETLTTEKCTVLLKECMAASIFMLFQLCGVVFLPGNYTNTLLTKDGKLDPPVCKIASKSFPVQKSTFSDETGWLKKLKVWSNLLDPQNRTAFSSFHSQYPPDELFKTLSTLFPLFFEPINSPAMVRYCMKIIKRLVDFLNPSQVSVIAGDQPAYALGKKVQWMYPSHHNGIVWMMGPLHIGMAFLSAIGTGWKCVVAQSH